MKLKMRSLIGIVVIAAVVTAGFTQVAQSAAVAQSFDPSTDRLASVGEIFSWILDPGYEDETGLMSRVLDEVAVRASETELASVSSPFDWVHTLNFTNSNDTFGNFIMTPEEVGENLRNFIHQVLYSDIEVACEVSILDIMLFRVFDSIIIDWLDFSFSGFCNGMAQASRDYFINPNLIPLGKDYAVQLPAPNPNATIAEATHGDVTETAIKDYVLWKGSGAFFNPNHLLNWIKIYLGLTSEAGGVTNAEEFLKVAQAMRKGSPSYQPVVILLMAPWWDIPEPTSSHFVVVYDYETNTNGTATLYIYNNWYTYGSSSAMYDDWILLQSDGSFRGTHRNPEENWTRMAFYPATSEYNSIFTLAMEAIQFLMDLLTDFTSLGIFSPVDVEITDPLGRTLKVGDEGVTELGFPAIAVAEEGHKFILMPHLPGMAYSVNLTGTDTGSYRMEVSRSSGHDIFTEEVIGNTTPGESDLYSVTLEGSTLDLAKQGVSLSVPQILSASSAKLTWTEYTEPDFLRYEVLVSSSVDVPGEIVATMTDRAMTSATVTGLSSETTYFFSVRVVTDGEQDSLSNVVGAVMPSDYTPLLLMAAAAGGGVVLLIVVVALWRRRGA